MRSIPGWTLVSELTGLWSDGRSSQIMCVRLRRLDAVLQMQADSGELREWPLTGIRISPRLASTPRTLKLPDGGWLEIPDDPLLDSWFSRPSSRIEAWVDRLERHRYAILTAAFLTVALAVAFIQYGLPWAALKVAERIPESVEKSSSNQVVAALERLHIKPSALPEARQRQLQADFRALVAGEPRAEQMQLLLVDAEAVGPNAFALPDGRIYMTDQLIELAQSDDELLAILAHEAGHHVHRHGMRNALESTSIFLLVGLLLGDASGSSLAVALPATLLGNSFSRGHESEADAYAFDLLLRRGRSPEDFAVAMERIATAMDIGDGQGGYLDDGVLGYLSSHPPSRARIEAARRAAQSKSGQDAH